MTNVQTYTVSQRFLTKKNEATYRNIFKSCFYVEWRSSVPFSKDPVYAATDSRGDVLGFCMVHAGPPRPMKYGPGGYMYNLCVDPQHRLRGVASAILRKVVEDFPICYAHADLADSKHNFMTKLGWARIGANRQYEEYVFRPVVASEYIPVMVNPRQYDPVNNVIYIDA